MYANIVGNVAVIRRGYREGGVDVRHLRYFVAVAEELNFRRAAKRLCISQPPLSLQIQQLEQELGSRLLDRTQQRVALTATGRLFLDRARGILADIASAKTAVAIAESGEGGELRIGFTQSSEFERFVSQSIKRFRLEHPTIALALREMSSADQIEAVAQGRIDLGIGRRPRGRMDKRVELTELSSDNLMVVIPSTNPLASLAGCRMKELQNETFVSLSSENGSGLRQLVASLCWDQGFAPRVVQEAHELSTAVSLVAAGLGIALVPGSMRALRVDGVSYVPVLDEGAKVSLYALHDREQQSAPKTTFLRLLTDEAGMPS